ncbi:MAG TPA: lysylphosphatidylglycerol synthase transmembrane domain-containing protein [Bryobacteraceae bacterium]|jgi:hypothetical protein|nr:lysylphosphatidylglycerol synthase transmembrane domain-containing protein [Bryobacteraceae bacterium]
MSSYSATSKRSYRYLYWATSLLFAAVLLYFSLRGINWGNVWQTLIHANFIYVLASGLSVTAALFLRAIRWRVLLLTAGEVSVPTAFWATSAGYFANNFLPARAGEVIRSFMISSAAGLRRTFVLTTALAERLSDAISLVLISSVVLLTLAHKPGWFADTATPFAILGFCGAGLIAFLPRIENQCHSVLYRLPCPQLWKSKLLTTLTQVMVGMRSFHDGERLLTFFACTASIWFIDGYGVVFGMVALGLHCTLRIALLLLTGLGLGSALPATPGYVGIYQFVAVSILAPFGFSKTDAIAYILLAQAVQYVVTALWGVLGMSRARVAKPLPTT